MKMKVERASMKTIRHLLDADNIDSKVALRRTCDMVMHHVTCCIDRMVEQVAFPELLIYDDDNEINIKKMKKMIEHGQVIDDFVDGIITALMMVESLGYAANHMGADNFMFANRFIECLDHSVSKLEEPLRDAFVAHFYSNTEKLKKEMVNG